MIDPGTLPNIEEIEFWRKANAIPRESLADSLGVSMSMYSKWASAASPKQIPIHKQAEAQALMKPRPKPLPDRISVDASWREVRAWSKAFKESDAPDLQSWMLEQLNNAAHVWSGDDVTDHRPADISAAQPDSSANESTDSAVS